MRIGIVAPCPVPYEVGGAEKLWWGLLRYINAATPHQADIIKLPSPERTFWDVVQSYEAFSGLHLDGFDCIVSTKYPAWMVAHPSHAVYLQHRLRGLYDTYSQAPDAAAEFEKFPATDALLNLLERHPGERHALPELFDRLRELRISLGAGHNAFRFPGPLIREVVHWLDGIALAPGAIARYSAIARTVAARDGYFPDGVDVTFAHHPSNLSIAPGKRFDYFFTASRLDGPKRVALLVEAMRWVSSRTELWIAGSGPDEARLRQLAESDRRIRWLGFVGDNDLVELYRNALAVPFVPDREDYGLITVEAMMAGKPVITTIDAGGPTELVRDGENGYVVEPSAQAIGQALQRLADDHDRARHLGAAGRARAEAITWQKVLDTVLPEAIAPSATIAKPQRPRKARKLVVATTFPIWPPRFGGPSRVFHLYRELAREYDVAIVSLVDASLTAHDMEIAPGVREVRIPRTRAHMAKEAAIGAIFGMPVSDIVATELYPLTPEFEVALRREARDATALVACHPYLYPALSAVADGRPIWYEAQDIEFHLKERVLPERPEKVTWLARIRDVEERCCRAARWVIACSEDDATTLRDELGVAPERIVLAPNGTDRQTIRFTTRAERVMNKRQLGAAGVPLALFMGSGHPPNIEAVQQLFTLARELPEIVFIVLGNAAYAFVRGAAPPNVWLLGECSDTVRQILFDAADVALNPMRSGSGTNLKMLDYFAAGLPVVTTAVGARGLPIEDGEHVLIRELDEFAEAIVTLIYQPENADALTENARKLVDRRFNWEHIGGALLATVLADQRPA